LFAAGNVNRVEQHGAALNQLKSGLVSFPLALFDRPQSIRDDFAAETEITGIRSPRLTYDRSEQAGHHALTDAFYFNLAEFEIAMPAPVFLPGSDWLRQNSAAWLKWSKNYCCAREWYVVG